jgi:alkanesulfonate monooxygenase
MSQQHGMNAEVFSTCPQSIDCTPEDYLERVREVSRWSEEAGCKGMLVYTDNGLVDPWLVSQVVLENTERLCPLVAVQPIYMHPYTAANLISSLSFLHHRQVYLNMLAGGFRNDLIALGDDTPHDRRYDRMTEYTRTIVELLERSSKGQPFSFDGEFYRTDNLKLTPPLPPELLPGIFVSGSSDAGMAASRALGATAIQYPQPPRDYDQPLPDDGLVYGIRVGIIARPRSADAWQIAHERFPSDRGGQLMHQLAMKVSDSQWHRTLSDLGDATTEDDPYWLVPFQNYKTMCPYLVGSYEEVAAEIGRYMDIGYSTFILDIPPQREELGHTAKVFGLANAGSRAIQGSAA